MPAVTKAHARSEEISLHLAQKRKSPTAGAWGGVSFFETRTSCVSNTRKQGDLSGGLTMLHRVQRQCVTFAVTIARVTVTQRMPLRQQQLKLRSWVGRLRYVLGIIQPRPLWPSPGSGGSRRCLAPAAGGIVILLNVGPPLLHPFNLLNIPAALCCRWFL